MKRRKPQPPVCQLAKVIGENAKHIRVSHGWTQEEIAKAAHTSIAMVSSVERAKRSPSIDMLERLAKALYSSPVELVQR